MNFRTWDPQGVYKEAFVKEYKHWVLEISFRQHTLGCYIIFAKRAVQKISELEDEEITELKHVMKEIENVLSRNKTFSPERFNYMQLGNALHHLHFHGIPRYQDKRLFGGKKWKDPSFGHPPVWSNTEVDSELVIKLRNLICKELGI